jgi:hypothetical protein
MHGGWFRDVDSLAHADRLAWVDTVSLDTVAPPSSSHHRPTSQIAIAHGLMTSRVDFDLGRSLVVRRLLADAQRPHAVPCTCVIVCMSGVTRTSFYRV